MDPDNLAEPSTSLSFIVQLICFAVVALYGHRGYVMQYITRNFYE